MSDQTFISITGTGLITPLGANLNETWNALVEGRFITNHARCSSLEGTHDRARGLAARVAQEAMNRAAWDQPKRLALIVATSKGAVESWIQNGKVVSPAGEFTTSDKPSNSFSELDWNFGLSDLAGHLQSDLDLKPDLQLTIAAACATGLHGLIRAAMLLRSGEVDRALVVSTESSLHPLFLGSFARLGVLAPPEIGCRPFDQHRRGFLMSECAAAVCLERSPHPAGAVTIDRFALGADPTSITGSDPAGATLKYLLRHVAGQDPIDLVHAHGTGTDLNDPIELSAIVDSLRSDSPAQIYSHKGALGHSLGAAGLVAAVLNIEMHRQSIVLPNVQTPDPLPSQPHRIDAQPIQRTIQSSIALAAGFGGACAAIRFQSSRESHGDKLVAAPR